MLRRKKTPRRGGAFGFFAPSSFDPLPPDLAPCRVFLPPQVAGLHRAVPSAALDKVIQFYKGILYQVFPVCQLGFEKYSLSRNYNQKKPHEIRQKEIPATWRGFLKGVNYSSMSMTTLFPRCGQSHESFAFAGTLLIEMLRAAKPPFRQGFVLRTKRLYAPYGAAPSSSQSTLSSVSA